MQQPTNKFFFNRLQILFVTLSILKYAVKVPQVHSWNTRHQQQWIVKFTRDTKKEKKENLLYKIHDHF